MSVVRSGGRGFSTRQDFTGEALQSCRLHRRPEWGRGSPGATQHGRDNVGDRIRLLDSLMLSPLHQCLCLYAHSGVCECVTSVCSVCVSGCVTDVLALSLSVMG